MSLGLVRFVFILWLWHFLVRLVNITKENAISYLGAVSLTGCGFAQDRWGQAGSGRGLGSPRWASKTLEYRYRWLPGRTRTVHTNLGSLENIQHVLNFLFRHFSFLTFQSLWQWAFKACRCCHPTVGVAETRWGHTIWCVLQKGIQQPETFWGQRWK